MRAAALQLKQEPASRRADVAPVHPARSAPGRSFTWGSGSTRVKSERMSTERDVAFLMNGPRRFRRSGAAGRGWRQHGMTPFSAFQRTVRDATDPVQRRPESLREHVEAG